MDRDISGGVDEADDKHQPAPRAEEAHFNDTYERGSAAHLLAESVTTEAC
jgi:hypothetical protein